MGDVILDTFIIQICITIILGLMKKNGNLKKGVLLNETIYDYICHFIANDRTAKLSSLLKIQRPYRYLKLNLMLYRFIFHVYS